MSILLRHQIPSKPVHISPVLTSRGYAIYDIIEADGTHIRWRYRGGDLISFIRYEEIAPGQYRPHDIWEKYVEEVKQFH